MTANQAGNTQPGAPTPVRMRPIGVSFLAILLVIGGIAIVAVGAESGDSSSFVNLYLGFTTIIIGWGLWKGKGWAWNWFIITGALGIVILLITLPGTTSTTESYGIISGLAFDVVSIYYVTRRGVMEYFGKTSVLREFA